MANQYFGMNNDGSPSASQPGTGIGGSGAGMFPSSNMQMGAGPGGQPQAQGGGGDRLVPPELQSIIDKVAGTSMKKSRANALVSLAGVVGGLEEKRRGAAASGQGLGIEQQRVDLASKELNLKKEMFDYSKQPASESLLGMINKGATSEKAPSGDPWHSKYKDIGDFFK